MAEERRKRASATSSLLQQLSHQEAALESGLGALQLRRQGLGRELQEAQAALDKGAQGACIRACIRARQRFNTRCCCCCC